MIQRDFRRSVATLIVTLAIAPMANALVWMPDANLRNWVNMYYPGAISGQYIDETNAGVIAATQLMMYGANVSDFTGLSAFANVTQIDASNNPISAIYDGPPNLQFLTLANCGFSGSFTVPPGISYLNVLGNQITSLNFWVNTTLSWLNCRNNQISGITNLNNVFYTLQTMDCAYNQLTGFNNIPAYVNSLDVSHNLFTAVPYCGSALTSLNASYNQITDVSMMNGAQYNFQADLSHNLIDHIDWFPNAANVDLSFNPLTQGITALPFQLTTLRITNTQMPCLPYLDNALQHLYASGNTFTCLPNQPVGLSMTPGEIGFTPSICGSSSPCYAPLPSINVRVFLQGPFDFDNLIMHDDLRAQGLLPTTEPYSALGFVYSGVGCPDTLDPAVFNITGPDAIVDWVVVDMFPGMDLVNTGNASHYSRPALLQRDGDIVGLDGSWPLKLNMPYGPYNTAVRHRNHLGAIKKFHDNFSTNTPTVDFTDWVATACYGYAMHGDSIFDPNRQLWCGDVTFNHHLKYVGAANDRDPILVAVGALTPANTISGVYMQEDVNMDGVVKYVGAHNDRDPILQNIGGYTPANTRQQVAFQ